MNLDRIRELRECHRSVPEAHGTPDEIDAAFAAAEALARMEAWLLGAPTYDRLLEVLGPHAAMSRRDLEVTLFLGGYHGTTQDIAAKAKVPTLLAALTAALDQAEAKP